MDIIMIYRRVAKAKRLVSPFAPIRAIPRFAGQVRGLPRAARGSLLFLSVLISVIRGSYSQ